ncbi:MAG TPA: tetratricopeptide repeat protein [Pirellulales bacterium]|nr:tetratricopeptide repeat protein [Pirellulales bacterium]
MKTERRHELQSNELADFLTDMGEKAKPYAKGLLGVVLAALVIVLAYIYLTQRAKSEDAQSWNEAWKAIDSRNDDDLRDVIKRYPNKPAALWSQLVLADDELSRGVAGLFAQRSAGRDLLTSAADDYRYVAEHSTLPLVREQALFGLGRAEESLNELAKAREAYESVAKSYPNGPYAKRAELRLAQLNRDSAKVFYDWFAAAELPTSPGKSGLFPGAFDESGSAEKNLPPLPPGFVLPDIDKSKTPPAVPKTDEKGTKPSDVKPDAGKAAEPSKPSQPKAGEPKSAEPKSTGDSKAPSDSKAATDSKSPAAGANDSKSPPPASEPAKPSATPASPPAVPPTSPAPAGGSPPKTESAK